MMILPFVTIQYDPFLSSEVTAKYSDDANFFHYTGWIREAETTASGKYLLRFKKVIATDGEVEEDGPFGDFSLRAFSSDPEAVWTNLNPKPGLKISFIASPLNIRIYLSPPIVQITVDGREALAYEDGKAALLEWAATVH